jgi:hypothetical protein
MVAQHGPTKRVLAPVVHEYGPPAGRALPLEREGRSTGVVFSWRAHGATESSERTTAVRRRNRRTLMLRKLFAAS